MGVRESVGVIGNEPERIVGKNCGFADDEGGKKPVASDVDRHSTETCRCTHTRRQHDRSGVCYRLDCICTKFTPQKEIIPPLSEGMKIEEHYSVQQIARALGFKQDTIRRLFRDEPGVISITGKLGKQKEIRVPHHVFERVYRRMQNAPEVKPDGEL